MENRIVEKHGFSKLPLEVIGLVLKKLDGDNQVEELKKCKFVSSRLYKATQDLFQDEFEEKLCTHFNGFELNFTRSRTFGMNIFGSYKLNFPIVKISRAEFYLMKSWLEKLIPTNIQNLELKDNLLNWKEIIHVLAFFPKIANLKYIQSSDDMIVADKIYNIYKIDGEDFDSEDFFIKLAELFQVKPDFLSQLKTFEVEVVHWNISNILSQLVIYSQCQDLEKFLLKIDLFGIYKSEHFKNVKLTKFFGSSKFEIKLDSIFHFEKFAGSLKYLELNIDDSKIPQSKKTTDDDLLHMAMSHSILEHFTENKMIKFDQIESLVLKSPRFSFRHALQDKCKLAEFIKKQNNLQYLEISYFDGQMGPSQKFSNEHVNQFLSNLMVHGNKTRFGFHTELSGDFDSISQIPENLSRLKLRISGYEASNWKFSDQKFPRFPNCYEMVIEICDLEDTWDTYEFSSMIEKFQNLEKLIFLDQWDHDGGAPEISDQDFQIIIGGLPHLKVIHIDSGYMVITITDSGLTGLTSEAIEARKENPSEPSGFHDRTGLPVSHLKNLESLAIVSGEDRLEISDITAHHAFKNMPKLKLLNISCSKVSREGFETILEKTGSKNLNIVQLTNEDI